MRRPPPAAVAIAILTTLGACSREPDFDERYEAAEQHIRKTAKDIDSEIRQREQMEQTGAPATPKTQSPTR